MAKAVKPAMGNIVSVELWGVMNTRTLATSITAPSKNNNKEFCK